MDFHLENTRRDLIAMRVKHGKDSKIGSRCTLLIGQLQNYQTATGDQKTELAGNIQRTMADLAKLAGQGE
jgi:hypothetical protein